MTIWAEVFQPDGSKKGVVYNLNGATVARALDAAGTITVNFPAAAQNDATLITPESRLRIWIKQDETARILGSGIVRELEIGESESQANFTANGPDDLDELTRKSTFIKRVYTDASIASIADDLMSLVTSWSALTDSGLGTQSMRFDGVSVLKAMIRLASENGLHIRQGLDYRTIELGVFGTDNGVIAMKPGLAAPELDNADNLLLISHINRKTNSRDVVNFIVPVGKGDNVDTAVNLSTSTHTVAHFLGPDGITQLYYLTDDDSIDTYGQIEEVPVFKDVTTADALYDAASAWLARQAMPLVTYTIECKKVRTTVRPGDKVRVMYKGTVETESGSFTYLDINDTFWVIHTSENVSDEGLSLTMDVATVDRYETDTTEIIVSALEKITSL